MFDNCTPLGRAYSPFSSPIWEIKLPRWPPNQPPAVLSLSQLRKTTKPVDAGRISNVKWKVNIHSISRTALLCVFSLDTPHPLGQLNSRRRSPNQPPKAGKDTDVQESDHRSPEGRCAWGGRNRIETLLDQFHLGAAFLVNRTPEVAAKTAPDRGVFVAVCAVDANVCICVLEHVFEEVSIFSDSSPIWETKFPR